MIFTLLVKIHFTIKKKKKKHKKNFQQKEKKKNLKNNFRVILMLCSCLWERRWERFPFFLFFFLFLKAVWHAYDVVHDLFLSFYYGIVLKWFLKVLLVFFFSGFRFFFFFFFFFLFLGLTKNKRRWDDTKVVRHLNLGQ